MKKVFLIPIFIFCFSLNSYSVSKNENFENQENSNKKTIIVKKGKFVSSLDLIGDIEAKKQIFIASTFSSKLEMLAEDGQKVKKNQVIAKLVSKEQQDKLTEEAMKLEIAKNDLDLLDHNSDAEIIKLDANIKLAQQEVNIKALELKKVLTGPTKEELKKLQLNVEISKKSLNISKINLKQKNKLYEKGIVKLKDILELELVLARAEKDYQTAHAEYILTKAGSTDTTKEIARLELKIAKNKLDIEEKNKSFKLKGDQLEKDKIKVKIIGLQVKVDQLKRRIEDATIKAPVDGTVIISKIYSSGGLSKVKVGDEVRRGRPFMSIANLEDSIVKSELEEQYIGLIKPGLPCDITLTNLKDKTFKAKVVKVGILATEKKGFDFEEGASKVFELDIALVNKNNDFKPGMSVDIKIILKTLNNVIVIPNKAIYKEGAKNYVLLESGEKRVIHLIDTNSKQSVIENGISAGDKIIFEEDSQGEV